MTLLRFGLEYWFHTEGNLHGTLFWRVVKDVCTKSLEKAKGDTEAVLDMVSLMKEAGILSSKVMRQVGSIIDDVYTLTNTQLVEFTLIFSSTEMQRAIDISDSVSRLENALI